MAVYLLHFMRPIAHSQHYIGFTDDISRRMGEHERGRSGAGIVREFHDRRIGFVLARTWPNGDRVLERRLKKVYKSARKLCPECKNK